MLLFIGDWAAKLLVKVFGSRNTRLLEDMLPMVEEINAREPYFAALSDEELRAWTPKLKAQVEQERTRNGYPELMQKAHALRLDRRREEAKETREEAVAIERAALESVMVDAFAACREASKRVLGMRHYDVQLIGGMVLHQGKIAEMVTGEGKTLVATLPMYLNALAGHGVHVITVNDYLAKRDADWNRPILTLLGLTIGAIQSNMFSTERQRMYACDVTYGTNNEFGFDYLRDNMKSRREEQSQGYLYYAIIDEVDSILIDEARTPLIISGQADRATEKYYQADRAAKALKKNVHFEVKEKEHQVLLEEDGVEEAQRLIGVGDFYTGENMDWPHHIDQALKANYLYQRDKDYVVEVGESGTEEVIIVDEFTGRKMAGRRWSDGLHQAVEAKEGLNIKNESQTLATVTLQNFFRLYDRLSGMTGTAQTEADELHSIYKLDVVTIPTNRPLRRLAWQDVVYRTPREKMKAVLDEIERVHALGRPMLVGTASVERSEQLSEYLNRRGVPHDVLNAKNHGREASIVAFAGFLRHVTVATNMAGRGTDILLGPAPAEISDLEPVVEWIGSVFWKKGMKRLRFADFSKLEFEDARQRLIEHVDTFVNEAIDAWTAQTKAPLSRTALGEVDQVGMRKVLASALKQVGIKDEVQVYNLSEPLVTLVQAGKNVHSNFKGGIALMGGLHVLGTERHESRRIDNQLRGRCGRQGDPGSSQFFLSLQDDLMRIFAPDRVSRILERLGMTEGQEISHGMVSRAIGRAQQKVEARNFDIRKNLLEYDGVMDEQRKVIYQQRQAILEGADTKAMVLDMVEEASEEAVENYASDEIIPAERDYEGLADWVKNRFDYEVAADELKSKSAEEIEALLMERARALHHERESVLGAAGMRTLERFLMLQKIDEKWKDHLAGMDQLRSGVGLHGYAQEDPKIIYKKRGFEAFQAMLNAIQEDVTSLLYRVRLVTPEEERRLLGRTWGSGTQMSGPAKTSEGGGPSPKRGPARSGVGDKTAADEGARAAARAMQRQQRRDTAKPQTNQPEVKEPVRVGPKVGRNEPCPCGSGKKFKRCCGK